MKDLALHFKTLDTNIKTMKYYEFLITKLFLIFTNFEEFHQNSNFKRL